MSTPNTKIRRPIEPSELEAYQRDGAVCLKGIIDTQWLELLDEVLETMPDEFPREPVSGKFPGKAEVMNYATRVDPRLEPMAFNSPAGEIAATMMGSERAYYLWDQSFYKFPGPMVPTFWHQDAGYQPVDGPSCRVWVPLEAMPRHIVFEHVRGSHQWNVLFRPPYDDYEGGTSEVAGEVADDAHWPELPDILAHQDSFDIIGWDVEPGDCIAFDLRNIHGTRWEGELTQKRRAWACAYVGDDSRYRALNSPLSTPHPDHIREFGYDFNLDTGDPFSRCDFFTKAFDAGELT